MGLRWRKIFNTGGFRTTLSTSGAGFSWGVPGLRFGIASNGRKYLTIGFPNTGLYYTKYFKNVSPNQNVSTRPEKNIQNNATTEKKLKWWNQSFFNTNK